VLDSETKRRIDTARDILVGKVPDPKSQVEQITVALIYKFMDDIDADAESLGGKRKFFANDFERYGWAKLMRSGLGGHDVVKLYDEGIAKMPENPGLPSLFRDIFKNAYLPYRDPETLRAFLKIIDEFTYDHSEKLGDAFEYLLSVLGSQGDAGQFRTPRHIIDFIVSIVDPKKNETVLDPACGTAGFLISSYKHILQANTDARGRDTLSAEDRERLGKNFTGYDISPDMVRLSLVNMYLHRFPDPRVEEYDTLTQEDNWDKAFDVILANPPFMSPKGGIKPHKRFSIQAKRSEVLFVDYIAEHLRPNGRAGIIVPEGIIFQSQTAYTQLRKMLVENYLVAVVSLPAGIFNPYSGVKTSILILDKSLARKADTIAFFKVENDGLSLGAQRREIAKNDLPQVKTELKSYLHALRTRQPTADLQLTRGLIVPEQKIAANGEYNLSGERYREGGAASSDFPYATVADICEINPESVNPSQQYSNSFFNYIDISCVENRSGKFLGANRIATLEAPDRARRPVRKGDVLISTVRPNLRAFTILTEVPERAVASTGFAVLRSKAERVLPNFLIDMLRHDKAVDQMVGMMGKGAYPSINQTDVQSVTIPLPPLDLQKEIVSEIEGYQKVIDGARAVVDNYRPQIPVKPEWPVVAIADLSREVKAGFASGKSSVETNGVPHIRPMNVTEFGEFTWNGVKCIEEDEFLGREDFILQPGDVLFNNTNSKELVGKTCLIKEAIRGGYSNHMTRIRVKQERCDSHFLAISLHAAWVRGDFLERANKWIGQAGINGKLLGEFRIPLPPLPVQQAIVAEIEAEQALVAANRELIARFERKIQATLARVWGEEPA